jgi:Methyltransferase small domain
VGERLIFSDHAWPELPHPGYSAFPHDQVMFVGIDSRFLARSTSRRPVRSALDLCTGSGIHALLAAAHSQRAVAVDINPRAVCCARFNAEASGVTNLEVFAGDLFEPVQGERFDLITANPPFVPSPVDAIRFRDGGHSGEEIQKRIVEGLPRHLAPGGMAQVVTELGEREGEPIVNRLREWLDGAPMDIHVLRLNEYSATKYAIGHAKGDDYAEFLDSVQAWAGNLRAQRYEKIISLLVSFQWSDPAGGPPWERVEESKPPRRAAGAEIEAAFLAERLARKADLQRVLARSWVRRSGPIALLDAQVLDREIHAHAKATLMSQALTIEHALSPVERKVLCHMEGRTAVSDLLLISRDLGVDESNILAAITSLLRWRLACLEVQPGS